MLKQASWASLKEGKGFFNSEIGESEPTINSNSNSHIEWDRHPLPTKAMEQHILKDRKIYGKKEVEPYQK